MSIVVKIDGSSLSEVALSIKNTPEKISKVIIESVNSVAKATFDIGKKEIVNQVNLKPDYVDSKMTLDLATTTPTATITGVGRGVLLANFGAKQIVKSASSRAKGNPKLGIAKGYKAAGVSVNVKASSAGGNLDHGFFMKLKNGNGMGVFTRDAFNKVRVRYGPSVDQVFKGVIEDIDVDVAKKLELEIISRLEKI